MNDCPYSKECIRCYTNNKVHYGFCNVYRERQREEHRQAESRLDINVDELFIAGGELIR